MKISGGLLKGKKLFFLKSQNTRPLKNIVKEGIFNVIKHSSLIDVNVKNSKILDLYSGMGTFGIECLSHQAKEVIFVEKDNLAIKYLKNNLELLNISNKIKLFEQEIDFFLKKTKEKEFNIIFLDPPFKDQIYLEHIKTIKKKGIFTNKNLFIIHRENFHENLESIINIDIVKKYGRSRIIFGHV